MAGTTDAATAPEVLFVRWRDHGDTAALAAVFDAEAPVLFKTAVVICSDPSLAEEAVQETFLAAMESARAWDEGRRVGPWLTGILRIKILEIRRRNGRRPDPRRLPPPPSPEDPLVASAAAEDVERVRAAIRALPEPYRHAALLRWCYGLEPAQIADLRGEPPGTTWSLLSRAMAKLRRELGALPVLLALHPEEAGLPGIRRVVLERARPAAPPGGGTPSRPGSAGPAGAPISRARWLAAGTAVIVVLGIAASLAHRRPGDGAEVAEAGGRGRSASLPASRAAGAGDRGGARADSPFDAENLPPPVDFAACDRDRDLFGVVVDADGAPVGGAEVASFFRPNADYYFLSFEEVRERVAGPATRTAADGTFRLPLARGTWCDLQAKAEGRGRAFLGWRIAGEKVRMVLRESASVLVRTVDPEGRPVPGVRISPARYDESGRTRQLPLGVTDAAGRCLLPEVAPGLLWFHVEHEEFVEKAPGGRVVPSAGTIAFDIPLVPGRRAGGVVRDGRTGAPVAGARVGVGSTLWNAVRTGADGRFEILLDPSTSRENVCAQAPGFARAAVSSSGIGEIEIALRPGDAVTGRLLGADGNPVAGARVLCVGAPDRVVRYGGLDPKVAVTDGDGRFLWTDLRHGGAFTLLAEAAGHGRLQRDFAPAGEEGGTTDLGDLRLPPSRSIEGVLVDDEGRPLPDRPIVLFGPAGPWAGANSVDDIGRRTDDLGRFRFAGRSPGAYRIAVGADPRLAPAEMDVTVTEAADATGLTLRIPPPVPLAVVAVDPEGRPVPGAHFTVHSGEVVTSIYADGEGRARVCVPPGRQVRVLATDLTFPPRYVPAEPAGTGVAPGTGEQRFVLRPAARVRGRLFRWDGTPFAGAWIHCREAGTDVAWNASSQGDGGFEALVPRGARMEIWATAEEEGVSDAVECATPAEGLELRLRPAGPRSLTVRVLDPGGLPLGGMALCAPAAARGGAPVTNRRGEVVLEGLGEGETCIGLRAVVAPRKGRPALPEGAAPPEPIRVVPGGQVVVLQLRAGVPVAGRVWGTDGLPAAGATVRLEMADGSVAGAATDAEGRFRTWIPPEVAVLRAAADGRERDGKPAAASLLGAAAQDRELEFRLQATPAK